MLAVRRRSTTAIAATTLTAPASPNPRQSLDLALAADTEPADLSNLEAAPETYGYGYGYHVQPSSQVLADLVADFGELRPLLSSPQPVATRVRVCRTARQMAGGAATVLMDLGAGRHARSWFATAATAARESGDEQLLSMAAGPRGDGAAELRRPAGRHPARRAGAAGRRGPADCRRDPGGSHRRPHLRPLPPGLAGTRCAHRRRRVHGAAPRQRAGSQGTTNRPVAGAEPDMTPDHRARTVWKCAQGREYTGPRRVFPFRQTAAIALGQGQSTSMIKP
ncbi:hypothetical protein GCM10022295_87380 [Streptomyces osmaniensis]|uniref:Uncharacterized protein n=1 Tax=Streptomyces osmaniensis TaxID=593134 RepID=A0ABP6YXD2_9ACTN